MITRQLYIISRTLCSWTAFCCCQMLIHRSSGFCEASTIQKQDHCRCPLFLSDSNSNNNNNGVFYVQYHNIMVSSSPSAYSQMLWNNLVIVSKLKLIQRLNIAKVSNALLLGDSGKYWFCGGHHVYKTGPLQPMRWHFSFIRPFLVWAVTFIVLGGIM